MPKNASSACTKLVIFVPSSCSSDEEAHGVIVLLCLRSFAGRLLDAGSCAVCECW